MKKIGKNPNYSHVDWYEKEYFEECAVEEASYVNMALGGITYPI